MSDTSSVKDDLSYLEQADAHADEGPLGEPAARSILAMALKYARAAQAREPGEGREIIEALKLVHEWFEDGCFIPSVEGVTMKGPPVIGPRTAAVREAVTAAIRALPHAGLSTIIEVCRNEKCPRGGTPVEIVVRGEPAPSPAPVEGEWPDPTPGMLSSPEFEAIWQCIKRWDINVPHVYAGYCGANGNHVRAILDALTASPAPLPSGDREDLANELDALLIATLGSNEKAEQHLRQALWDNKAGIIAYLRAPKHSSPMGETEPKS